jgi:hypothetical protein
MFSFSLKYNTLLVDVFVQYEYLMFEFHFVNNRVLPWLDYLRLIQNIFVQELDISFARREKNEFYFN